MPITVDELVVKLGLDASNFDAGQKKALDDFKKTQDAAKKTAAQMEQDGKQAGRFYSNIRNEALSTIAVLMGAHDIQKFVGDTVTNLSAVGRIATVMGQATPDVIAIGNAVERIGGNAQAAQQSMLQLSQAIQVYKRTGQMSLEMRQAFGFIGAGPSDTPMQIMQKFATWAGQKGRDPRDVEMIGGRLGLNQDLINLALKGRAGFDADIAKSYQLGIPSDQDSKKVQELQSAFVGLGQSLKFAGTELVVDMADPLSGLLKLISHVITDFPGATKAVMGLVAAFIALKGLGTTVGVAKLLLRGGGAAAEVGAGAAAAEGAATVGPLEALGGAAGTLVGNVARGAAIGGAGAGAAVAGGVGLAFIPSNLGTDVDVWRPLLQNPGSAPIGRIHAAIEFFKGRYLANPRGPHAAFYISALKMLSAEVSRRARGGGVSPGGGGMPADVAGRMALGQQMLENAGFSSAQAQGIMAGLFAESAGTLRTDIKNPGSTATGIAQWTKSSGRQALFKQVMGVDVDKADFKQQMQFVLYELSHGQMGALRAVLGQSSSAGAALAFLSKFEAPGAKGLADDWRTARRVLGMGGVEIGSIVINTAATDATGIAKQIDRTLSHVLATNANSGLH